MDIVKLSAYGLLAVFLISCQKPSSVVPVIEITPDNEMNVSDFVDNVKNVRLSKTESSALSRIESIRWNEDKIAINSNQQIYVFDWKGINLDIISKRGKGMGEYIQISDFQLYNDTLYVLSALQQSLLLYTCEGNFIRKYDLNDVYRHFVIIGDGLIVLSSENNNDTHYNFVFYDLKKEESISLIDGFDKNEAFVFPSFNAFYGSSEKLLVGHPFDYSVYALNKDGISIVSSFAFNTQDQLSFDKGSYVGLEEETRNKCIVRYLQAYEEVGDNQYLVYPLFGESGLKTCITCINKKGDNKTIRIGKDVDNEYPYFFMGDYLGMKNGTLVMSVDASKLIELEGEYGFTTFSNSGTTEDDNPILFFYKLRAY